MLRSIARESPRMQGQMGAASHGGGPTTPAWPTRVAGAAARGAYVPHTKLLRPLMLLYALLNVGDLLTTALGLSVGLREGNPLMRHLLDSYGFGALIGYKIAVVLAVVLGVAFLLRGHRRLATVTLTVCCVMVGAAVALNITQFLLV